MMRRKRTGEIFDCRGRKEIGKVELVRRAFGDSFSEGFELEDPALKGGGEAVVEG
jgi:hypothetical protein